MPGIPFDRAVRSPEHVLIREVEGEAVLLNLQSENYFGLDDVGTRMWKRLVAAPSIDKACEELAAEYEVVPTTLRADLEALLEQLLARGLLVLEDASPENPSRPSKGT